MKKILLLLVMLSTGSLGFCTTWIITSSGYTFSPASLTISVGDTVDFTLGTMHDAVEVSQTTWNANDNTRLSSGFTEPYGGGFLYSAQLSVGTHYYVCEPHASLGMKGIIIVQSPTGIEENTLQKTISVYPNPSSGRITVDISSETLAQSSKLEIYNMQGILITSASDNALHTSNKFDLSNNPTGIYFVKLYSNNGIIVKKFVVE